MSWGQLIIILLFFSIVVLFIAGIISYSIVRLNEIGIGLIDHFFAKRKEHLDQILASGLKEYNSHLN